MSAIENEEVIQHIDDTCDEEYGENFAPKAQEEVLSEIQENNQTCDSENISVQNECNITNENEISENIVDEVSPKSESIEASNDDISNDHNENIELNKNESESFKDSNENIELNQNGNESFNDNADKIENLNIEVSECSDTNGENVEVDVIMKEIPAESCFYEVEKVQIDNNNDTVESFQSNSVEIESDIIDEKVDEEKVDEKIDAALDDQIKVQESEKNNFQDIDEDIKLETENKVQSDSSPIKGKDVKSLSSTYEHEDNIANGNCCICNNVVYPMEKLATNDRLFHKTCFRCTKCKNALSTGNFTFNHGKPYCTPHYVELFKKRGRYDEIDDNTETESSSTKTDIYETVVDELPAPDTTKNILAKFRDLQAGATHNVHQTLSSESSQEMPAPNTTRNLKEHFQSIGQEKSELKCKPKIDIPRHSNGHKNGGSSENEPVLLPSDVVRAIDPSQDDRPQEGITKNLLSRFRELESSTNN